MVSATNYTLWITFSRQSIDDNEHQKVMTYINVWLVQPQFSLRKDIINHKDISFFNNSIICFMINIYSDEQQTALKYLKNIETNLNNILIMTGNFNIRDNDWNPIYSHHFIYTNIFMEISFDLRIFTLYIQVPTWYADNPNDSNSVINLIFLWANSTEINNHFILPDL